MSISGASLFGEMPTPPFLGAADFDWSCAMLVQTHSQLSDLEERLENAQETQPLFA